MGREVVSVAATGEAKGMFEGLDTPATPSSLVEALQRQVREAEAAAAPRVFNFDELGAADAAALRASIDELEKAESPSATEPDELRAQLQGFWRLLFTSSSARARDGVTGYGEESSSRSLLAQFQRYTEQVEGGDPLTLQTVEVVGDAREGRALLAVGKGDFRVSKTPSTGELGVLEGFHKVEVDGLGQPATKMPSPVRWSTAFLDPSLRISREADGTVSVYSKVEPADTQAAIARLAETPVELAEVEEEVEDTRPLWDRPNDRWGQTETGGDSDIP